MDPLSPLPGPASWTRSSVHASPGSLPHETARPRRGTVGAIGSAGYREECRPDTPARQLIFTKRQAVTVGSPTPMTLSRRDSAVKANSFISWLV